VFCLSQSAKWYTLGGPPAVLEVNQQPRRKLGCWCGFMDAPHSHLLVGESNALPFLTKRSSAAQTALLALLVIVVSYLAARLGGKMVVSSLGLSVFWPPSALLVAAMLLVARRNWLVLVPAGLAGAAIENLQLGYTLGATGLFFLANTIEFLIIGLGLGYAFDGVPRLNSSKALAKYCFFAAFLAPLVGAFIGANASSGSYAVNWREWFFGEMLPFLTLTPAILSWVGAGRVWIYRSVHWAVEAAALLGSLAILGYLVLLAPWKTLPSALYSFVPLLLWAALRFGSLGVSTSMVFISFLSIWGAIHGHGPFTGPEPMRNVLSLQVFLIFAAIPFMALAAVVEERASARLVEKELSRRLISAQEQERIRIARELHDDVCQRLAMVSLKIEKAAKHDGNGQLTVAQQLEQIWQQCSSLTGDVQALSHELHPSILDNLGLVTAVKSYCREVARQNGVVVELSNDNLSRSLPQDVSLSVFRVVQEALRNAVKYSGQKHVKVSLRENSGHLELEVSDQGIGFDVANTRKSGGLGLVSMAERIYQVNGTLSIDSQPSAGTRIRARVPLAAPSACSN
jgi:signal transduction histidine kinase